MFGSYYAYSNYRCNNIVRPKNINVKWNCWFFFTNECIIITWSKSSYYVDFRKIMKWIYYRVLIVDDINHLNTSAKSGYYQLTELIINKQRKARALINCCGELCCLCSHHVDQIFSINLLVFQFRSASTKFFIWLWNMHDIANSPNWSFHLSFQQQQQPATHPVVLILYNIRVSEKCSCSDGCDYLHFLRGNIIAFSRAFNNALITILLFSRWRASERPAFIYLC